MITLDKKHDRSSEDEGSIYRSRYTHTQSGSFPLTPRPRTEDILNPGIDTMAFPRPSIPSDMRKAPVYVTTTKNKSSEVERLEQELKNAKKATTEAQRKATVVRKLRATDRKVMFDNGAKVKELQALLNDEEMHTANERFLREAERDLLGVGNLMQKLRKGL